VVGMMLPCQSCMCCSAAGYIHAAICWAVKKHVSNQASQRTCQKEPLAVLLPRMRQWPAAQLVDAAAAS
jgi:hypothetical protein